MFGVHSIVRHARNPFRRQTQRGAAPGSVMADPAAGEPVIRVTTYDAESVQEQNIKDVSQIRELVSRQAVTWISVEGLGDARVIERLGEEFQIHGLVLEDIVNVHQRAKVEEYEDYVFVVARAVESDVHVRFEQIAVILGKNFVLTFQETANPCFEPVRRRIHKGQDHIRQAGGDFLLYTLVDAVIDSYFPVLEELGEQLDRLEEQLLIGPSPDTLMRIHSLRSELFMLRRAIWPLREAVNSLMHDGSSWVTSNTRLYLRDCYDHSIQIIDVAEICREMCSDLRDFHFAQISLRQNDVMKVLTIVATIFIPMSFVTGLYGMNFDTKASPWNMPELTWYFGYPFAVTIMGAIFVTLLGAFWYRGWLGRDVDVPKNQMPNFDSQTS